MFARYIYISLLEYMDDYLFKKGCRLKKGLADTNILYLTSARGNCSQLRKSCRAKSGSNEMIQRGAEKHII